MKKENRDLNSIFSVAEEMVKDNGEDCFYYDVSGDRFIISALDGCGGSGSKKYENYSGKTGAYIASRAVCGGVRSWFCTSGKEEELGTYIRGALAVCKKYADKAGRLMGSLSKAFPTTAAIVTGRLGDVEVDINCYWAGDSRCYMLNADGLYQLTKDDLDVEDAMQNLTSDGMMTNVISASTAFEIHAKGFKVSYPCIFLTATDGCFGYLTSPMEFENLLLETLLRANSMHDWKIALNERFHAVAGDDYTLSVAICGFESFADIQKTFKARYLHLTDKYIKPKVDVNALWNEYKKEYSAYL